MSSATKTRTHRILTAGILGLGMLSLIPLSAHAWGRGNHERSSPDRATARLTERLDLTVDQQAKVKALL
ncbi:MAG: hypothetical protein IH608_07140, partial [Proteobacteria bacterium]|nr:hypothetical protein [Pseudomonadota bacterium]